MLLMHMLDPGALADLPATEIDGIERGLQQIRKLDRVLQNRLEV